MFDDVYQGSGENLTQIAHEKHIDACYNKLSKVSNNISDRKPTVNFHIFDKNPEILFLGHFCGGAAQPLLFAVGKFENFWRSLFGGFEKLTLNSRTANRYFL